MVESISLSSTVLDDDDDDESLLFDESFVFLLRLCSLLPKNELSELANELDIHSAGDCNKFAT